MLDPIPSLPRSNQALEWNLLFESRWINTLRGGAGLGSIGSAKGADLDPIGSRSDGERGSGRRHYSRVTVAPYYSRVTVARYCSTRKTAMDSAWVRPRARERRGEQEREREMCWND